MMVADIKMDRIDALSKAVYGAQMKDKEEVRQFIRDLTELIYDCKMIGMAYDFYAEDVVHHKQSRTSYYSSDEVVQSIIAFTAAFPDLTADIENVIVYKVDDGFYKIFRRLRYHGTNLGYSKFGPPTGKSLGDGCLNLAVIHLKKVNGAWKIVFEVNSDSEDLLRRTQSADPAPATQTVFVECDCECDED